MHVYILKLCPGSLVVLHSYLVKLISFKLIKSKIVICKYFEIN